MLVGQIQAKTNITGSISSSGNGTRDHNKLINRDLVDQHPIESITGLTEELSKKLGAEEVLALIQENLKAKASGLYFDAAKELNPKAYWYLTSEVDPITGQGTLASIISGPYDLNPTVVETQLFVTLDDSAFIPVGTDRLEVLLNKVIL